MPPDREPIQLYLVQGSETAMPHQLMSGNVPNLATDSLVVGISQGVLLLLLVWLLSRLLLRFRLGPWGLALGRIGLFVSFFGAWELGLHAAARPDELYVPDPIAFWKANPALADVALSHGVGIVGVGGRSTQIGIFDPDHQGPKPPGTWRVLALGDSQVLSSQGNPYAGKLTYPKLLEAKELRGPAGQAVQVVNGGMSGYTSWQGLMLLRSELLGLEPDVVVEAFGYHDGNPALSHDRDVLTDDPRVHRVRTLMYRSRVLLLVRSLVLRWKARRNDRSDPSTWVQRVPPGHFARNLETLVEAGQEHSFRTVFLLEPLRDEADWAQTDRHREEARRVAAARGVPVVDAFAAFAALSRSERAALFEDRIHLKPAGHRMLAELLEHTLRQEGLVKD